MCLKPPAEGDYLSGELVFLDREQLSGTGVQEHMAHLLSHPLTLLLLLLVLLCLLAVAWEKCLHRI